MGEATTDPVRLPPGPRIPKAATGIAFLATAPGDGGVAVVHRRKAQSAMTSPLGVEQVSA